MFFENVCLPKRIFNTIKWWINNYRLLVGYGNICTSSGAELYCATHQNEYIYFHIQPKTFLLHTRRYHKKLNNIYYIIFINKIFFKTLFLNKQILKFKTKVNQLLPLPFLRLSRNMNVYLKGFQS